MSVLEYASTRPYLIRALHEWCSDNGFTPYIAVLADDKVQVPREYVQNGEIVLNVSYDATSGLRLGNEFIEFKARFAGTAREILVPVDHVLAIYARENGQGMGFPMPVTASDGLTGVEPADEAQQGTAEAVLPSAVQPAPPAPATETVAATSKPPAPPKSPDGGAKGPRLRRVK